MKNFKKRVLHGLAWRSSVDAGEVILQISFTAVLARLLTRADFGLVAMAMLFTRFVRTITQMGIGMAVIQNQRATEAQVTAVFLIQLGINFLVSLICFLSAPLAADFFNEPPLAPLIRVLGWIIFLDSISFPQILLRKQMRFGGYSFLELTGLIIGNSVGVAMAYSGYGVWSLVYRLMIQRAIFALGVWPLARWKPVKPDFNGVGNMLRFGLHMLGSHICVYFSQNMAAIITGKFIGVETLGSFNIAYNLAIVPAQKIQTVLTTVLGSAFARVQEDLANFQAKFFASLFSLGAVFIPMMFGLAAVANNFVVVVYGSKWREAGVFLTFMAFVGMLKGLEHLMRSAIIASGRAGVIFGITLAETVASIPFLFIGAYYFQVMGVIVAFLAASMISFALTVRMLQKALQDRTIFMRATVRSYLVAGLMFIIVYGYPLVAPLPVLASLITQILLGMVIYALPRLKLLTDEERECVSQWPLGRLIAARR